MRFCTNNLSKFNPTINDSLSDRSIGFPSIRLHASYAALACAACRFEAVLVPGRRADHHPVFRRLAL